MLENILLLNHRSNGLFLNLCLVVHLWFRVVLCMLWSHLFGFFITLLRLHIEVESFLAVALLVDGGMADCIVQVLLICLQLLEGVLRVDHKLREPQLADFLLFILVFNLDFVHLMADALELLVRVLTNLFRLCCLQLIDLELAIELFLHFFHHEAHLSDVVLHFVVVDFHLSQLPLCRLQFVFRLVHRLLRFLK